ncbi:polyphosphate kinase 2 [Haematobacter massiliensis]|uniref:polyphosphate kinase 2 n=1 Tax=Haematobacter massiliensis TaxID=195105 RepID=UPI0005519885|nr:polyphosphate kinase 2 [Haematobacter massiliensis]OWJ72103.1 polyphosphate kinase 2 [Haematobacter massiliensis]OWJ87674.1 polyphosphate kinase 2 [Haematobacter massiliensis]QBJ24111.1 polyphosphate kinase 2 [Haematobacter massiliensis]
MTEKSKLPFDGAISAFYEKKAPEEIREAIKKADKKDILAKSYPYRTELSKSDYEAQMEPLQIELAKLVAHVRHKGTRLVILFEGRDAAGKGGSIAAVTENMNPRVAHTIALSKPSDREATQWYFQRYVRHLPAAGEIVIFDRSWYNRGVVEKVFGFCTDLQRVQFFRQLLPFEQMIVSEEITFVKVWLSVGRAEQLRRFLQREQDPLKQWKLSNIDVDGLKRWDDYTTAIRETLIASHTDFAPWTIVRSDDKRRERIAVIQSILLSLDYDGRDKKVIGQPDPKICGGLEMLDA